MLECLKSKQIQSFIRHITVEIPYSSALPEYLRILECCLELRSLDIILHNYSGRKPNSSFYIFERPKKLQSWTVVSNNIELAKVCAGLNCS